MIDAAGLRAIAALLDRPVVALDVGCRDGVRPEWRRLGRYGMLVGFDPDPEECARLNAATGDGARERYEPIALAGSDAESTLYLTASDQSSSLYPPNDDAIRRHPELWRHELRGTQTVQTSTLDSWAARTASRPIDALKLDVQGAELDILRGAEISMADLRLLELEVEFQPLYRGQPLFREVDQFLVEHGFDLWRLRDIYHCGLTPARRGEPVFAIGDAVETTRSGGRISWANAIYVRKELAQADTGEPWAARARDACIATVFNLPELAELALAEAVRDAPDPARRTLSRELSRARRRANRTHLRSIVRHAPTHLSGFVRARFLRH